MHRQHRALTSPAAEREGIEQAKKLPVYVDAQVSSNWNGTPCSRLPNATPKISGGTTPPTNKPQSQA